MPPEDRQNLLRPLTFASTSRVNSSTNMKSDLMPRPSGQSKKISWIQITSYVFDWIILIAVGVVGLILGDVTPNKRPFSLNDLNISFPVTEFETVNSKWLMMCNSVFPAVIILIVALVFVPGSTVPKGTPKKLIWRRKLWELHTGWLGLALSLVCAWIITQGMKNLFGKPRPDLLSRCKPDFANWKDHLAGFDNPGYGFNATGAYMGQLVKATICTSNDKHFLDDGFRSYPSGHSSSAAAGLIYCSLFLASKFALTIPFVLPENQPGNNNATSASAFPSRARAARTPTATSSAAGEDFAYPDDPVMARQIESHHREVTAVRLQAAAPPIYLLVVAVLPWFTSIFIASSRWFDFRHHGFDILFGYIIGTITAWFSFRYYHLPLRSGAGWAWGPRSHDKAFWAGVGSYTYANNKKDWEAPGDEEERMMSNRSPHGSRTNTHEGAMGSNIELANRSRSKLSDPGAVDTSYNHAM